MRGLSVTLLAFLSVVLGPQSRTLAARNAHFWPLFGNYKWQSALDRESGIASAKETSNVPQGCRLWSAMRTTKDSDLLRLLESSVKTYPTWLCSFPVTCGLLKAVSTGNGHEVRSRLFNIHFLSFGTTKGQRVSYRQKNIQTSQCIVALPMTGGFLALRPPDGGNDRGSVLFTFTKTQETSRGDNEPAKCACSITTALQNYRPWLAGSAPVNPFRKAVYLSTQSIIHAHVMWRFQRHLWSSPGTVDDPEKITWTKTIRRKT